MTKKTEDKPKKERVDATVSVVGPPPATGAS